MRIPVTLYLVLLGSPVLAQWAPPQELIVPGATESLAVVAATHSENLSLEQGVTATSSNVSATWAAAALARDGNPKTEWISADAGAILQLQFPAPTRINGVFLARDLTTETPDYATVGATFVIEASADGHAWDIVADTGKMSGVNVSEWAALFPEREVRFLRMRLTGGTARVGELGAFRADLTQTKTWGWEVPDAACRAALDSRSLAGDAPGVNLADMRDNAGVVVLPQSVRVVAGGVIFPTVFVPADPQLPEEGHLYWHEAAASHGTRQVYFNVGKPEEVLPPVTAGEWTAAGFQWRGQAISGAVPGRPVWGAGEVGGWVIPPAREGLRLALATVWDSVIRNKPLAATAAVENGASQAFQGQLRVTLIPWGRGAVDLGSQTLDLAAGAKEKRALSLDISRAACGDYLLTAQILRGGEILAEAQRPLYVGPVPHPGMSLGIYSVPAWNGPAGIAQTIQTAAETGFTELTSQYWGEGYSFMVDQALRRGMLWNPTIVPIYAMNGLADTDPSTAMIGPDGKRIKNIAPTVCYVHPEVVRRTEATAEKWLREIVTMPGFAGYIQADDDVHLPENGDYNPSCRDLFRQMTGREVPLPKAGSPTQPQDMPPPGLIADDQPWLQWFLFRCSQIRGSLPRIYMRAKERVDPDIKMGANRGSMQFPFYEPGAGEYPPLFDSLYDVPGSYAYLYWVRPTEDYIAHGALAAMGNRGRGRWMEFDFECWFSWILEKGGDGRWQLNIKKTLEDSPQNWRNLYPPGALDKEIWCMLAGGFTRLHAFQLPEAGCRADVVGTEDQRILQTWGARARAYGKLLTALQEPTRPVAILTSISTSAFQANGGLTHSGVASSVLRDCLREHMATDLIAEEEILAGGLKGRKVLLLPDLQYLRRGVAAVIEKWAKDGGVVIAETGAAVQPAGSRAVQRSAMAAEVGRLVQRQIECDNPLVVIREFELDGVRYYYLVNVYTDRWSAGIADDPWVNGNNTAFTALYTPRAQKARLRIPGGPGSVWDVFGNHKYEADAEGNIELTVGGDDGMLLAVLPQNPDQLAVKIPSEMKAGDEVTAAVNLSSADRNPVRGGVPVQMTVTDPNGADSEYSQYALATGGTARITFRTAVNDLPGTWRVQVRSLVGGAEGTANLQVTP